MKWCGNTVWTTWWVDASFFPPPVLLLQFESVFIKFLLLAFRWRTQIISPTTWQRTSPHTSTGRGKTTAMATTSRCRPWRRCTTGQWRFTSTAQVSRETTFIAVSQSHPSNNLLLLFLQNQSTLSTASIRTTTNQSEWATTATSTTTPWLIPTRPRSGLDWDCPPSNLGYKNQTRLAHQTDFSYPKSWEIPVLQKHNK